MARSPSASPRGPGFASGFGDASPGAQRRPKLRRRRSSGSNSSDSSDGGSLPQRSPRGDEQRTPTQKAPSRKTSQSVLGGQKTPAEDQKKAAEDKNEQSKEEKDGGGGGGGDEDGGARRDSNAPLARKLSVAALIRSFSPRSRAKAKADAATAAESQDAKEPPQKPPKEKPKTPRITFGTLKRASLSFPASPPAAAPTASTSQRRASHSQASDPPPPQQTTTTSAAAAPSQPTKSPTSVSKWKQAVQAVTKDAARLKIQIPPPPAPSVSPPAPVSVPTSPVDAQPFATGPGSLVDDVRATLAKLITLLDAVDPRKLRAIRLGGELRGLLGKAADEVDAYADAFRDHARASVGVAIALQNLGASLRQLFPILDKLRVAKFLLNRQFKQDVTFAFQEINSYYTSAFMELSMAVATRAGLVLPMPTPVAVVTAPEEEEEEEEQQQEEPRKAPEAPTEPTREALCLAAHRHFFGHACPVDLPRALALYKDAAAKGCAVAMRCLGHMYLLGKGMEKDLFTAEHWLVQAATASEDADDAAHTWYLLGCLLSEKAPHQKSAQLTRECWARAQTQFARAAQRGLADAQFQLAASLERGDALTPEDQHVGLRDRIDAALPWYRRAAEQSHTNAEAALGRLLLRQYDECAEQEEDPARASEAIHWLQRAASSGEHAEALTLLGVIFSYGRRGAKRDVDRGLALLRRAVGAGSCDAMLHLAKLLLRAPAAHDDASSGVLMATVDRTDAHDEALKLFLSVAQDEREGELRGEANFQVGELLYHSALLKDRAAALRFYLRAAQQKPTPHAVAARRAATMLYSGIGCARVDKPQAHRWYKVAADAGDAEALNALGLMYEDGDGCDLDFQRAASCYRRAVELGSAHAHFNLGCLLAHGKGVARNLDAAQAHFAKALSLGYELARDFLRPES